MPVRAELAFMDCLEGQVGAGSSQSRCSESRARPPEKLRGSAAFSGHGSDDHDCLGDWRLISQRNVEASGHSRRRYLFQPAQRAARQPHRRLSRRQIDHPQVAPEDTATEAGAESLRTGLLGGKAAGIARRSIGAPIASLALRIGKDTVEKAITITLDHLLDSADV